jgi:hypothetical protein
MNIHFEQFFEEKNELIAEIVSYHLMIEGLLERLLLKTLANPSVLDFDRIMFSGKLEMVRAMGLMDQPIFNLLKKLNALRNKFAHQMGFYPTFEAIHELVVEAGKAGVDFSDNVDTPDIEYARSLKYDVAMLLNVLYRNVFFEIAMAQGEEFWQDIIT